MKALIAGNWKMNGTIEGAIGLAESIESGIESEKELLDTCDFLVCPPFLHMMAVQGSLEHVVLGAQDCSAQENGAFTGEVSAAMIADLGAKYVILGHSERRQYHGESDELVAQKAIKAHEQGLITIICVGETEAEREEGKQNDVVGAQLEKSVPECATAENTVIAYEPVWAIGTGKSATADDIADMHTFIREKISALCLPRESEDLDDAGKDSRLRGKDSKGGGGSIRILYGGSMKPDNAAEILAIDNVNGGLIGGASLKADDFLGIARVA